MQDNLEKCFNEIKNLCLKPLLKFGYFYFKLASDITNGRKNDNFNKYIKPNVQLDYYVELRSFVKKYEDIDKFKTLLKNYKKIRNIISVLKVQRYYLMDSLNEILSLYKKGNIDKLNYMGRNLDKDISYIEYIVNKYHKCISKVFNENINLVKSLIYKYGYDKIPHVDKDDLFQYGCLGLYISIHRFDFNHKTKLSTYAIYWINQCIYDYVKNNFSFKLPKDILDNYAKLQKAFKIKSLDEFDSLNELKEYCGFEDLDDYSVSQLLNILAPMNINEMSKSDNSESKFKKIYRTDILFEFGSRKNSLLRVLETELKSKLSEVLDEIEFNVISYRFGLFDKPEHDIKDIVDILNLSKSTVKSKIVEGLDKIKKRPDLISLLEEFASGKGEYAC